MWACRVGKLAPRLAPQISHCCPNELSVLRVFRALIEEYNDSKTAVNSYLLSCALLMQLGMKTSPNLLLCAPFASFCFERMFCAIYLALLQSHFLLVNWQERHATAFKPITVGPSSETQGNSRLTFPSARGSPRMLWAP